jgi:hypothetical protein
MPVSVKPANQQQTATRRKELFLAFVNKVFDQMKRNGNKPVVLRNALGSRSEILAGLRVPGESVEEAQDRIIGMFLDKYPHIADSGAVSTD